MSEEMYIKVYMKELHSKHSKLRGQTLQNEKKQELSLSVQCSAPSTSLVCLHCELHTFFFFQTRISSLYTE